MRRDGMDVRPIDCLYCRIDAEKYLGLHLHPHYPPKIFQTLIAPNCAVSGKDAPYESREMHTPPITH